MLDDWCARPCAPTLGPPVAGLPSSAGCPQTFPSSSSGCLDLQYGCRWQHCCDTCVAGHSAPGPKRMQVLWGCTTLGSARCLPPDALSMERLCHACFAVLAAGCREIVELLLSRNSLIRRNTLSTHGKPPPFDRGTYRPSPVSFHCGG